jgi:hypothetical protein
MWFLPPGGYLYIDIIFAEIRNYLNVLLFDDVKSNNL